MSSHIVSVRGPSGVWTHEVKWSAVLSNGEVVEGYVGLGDEEGTAWHKLQALLSQKEQLFVTRLALQYRGLTIYAVPDADAYSLKASFATTLGPRSEYVEQVVLASFVDGKVYEIHLARDGRIWQHVREGVWEPSCVRGNRACKQMAEVLAT